MSGRVFVVIPCFNRKAITLACIEQLVTQTTPPYRIIVADGGSTDGTPAAIADRYPGVMILKAPEEYWWSGSMAQGMAHVLTLAPDDDDFLMMLNDDTIFPPDYVETMTRVALREQAAIAATIIDAIRPDVILDAGVSIDWRRYLFTATTVPPPPGTLNTAISVLSGRGPILPIQMVRRVGLIDHRAFPHYIGDYDYFLRVVKAGFRIGMTDETRIAAYTELTGTRPLTKPNGIKAAWRQAASRRSMANLNDHLRFVWRHAPGGKVRLTLGILRYHLGALRVWRKKAECGPA